MDPATSKQIFYPMFAMFGLTAFVLVRMGIARFGAVSRREMDPRYYSTYQEGEEPEHLRVLTRHFINHFEVPTLFYVAVLSAYVLDAVTAVTVTLAWLYVALRYVHTWVHLGTNDVLTRFRVYIASGVVLCWLWLCLLGAVATG